MFFAALFTNLIMTAQAISTDPCTTMSHQGIGFIVCSAEPAAVRVFHGDERGRAFGGFVTLRDALRRDQMRLVMAMNGGMYEEDLSAVGLLVTGGIEKHPLATGEGWGNFYLKPNGVFALADGRAMVMETGRFADSGVAPDEATQSGPMLVIDGAVHPAFLPEGTSLQLRNGIGVDTKGRVYLAISLAPVRFYDFATLFRDELDCPNALFLDGHISSLYAPSLGRLDTRYPMGPIIGVVEPMWRSATAVPAAEEGASP